MVGRLIFILGLFCGLSTAAEQTATRVGVFSATAKPPFEGCSYFDGKVAWCGLLATRDSGRSWTKLTLAAGMLPQFLGRDNSVRAYFSSPTTGWLSGRDSDWVTHDGGATWRTVDQRFDLIRIGASGRGWMQARAEGGPARYFVTSDSGISWVRCQVAESASLFGVDAFFIDARKGWMLAQQEGSPMEQVFKTGDGGCRWERVWTPTPEDKSGRYAAIQFADRRNGWISAVGYGPLSGTSDGGKTWSAIRLPRARFYILAFFLSSPNVGWLYGYSAETSARELYLTTTGGKEWARKDVGSFNERRPEFSLPWGWVVLRLTGLLGAAQANRDGAPALPDAR